MQVLPLASELVPSGQVTPVIWPPLQVVLLKSALEMFEGVSLLAVILKRSNVRPPRLAPVKLTPRRLVVREITAVRRSRPEKLVAVMVLDCPGGPGGPIDCSSSACAVPPPGRYSYRRSSHKVCAGQRMVAAGDSGLISAWGEDASVSAPGGVAQRPASAWNCSTMLAGIRPRSETSMPLALAQSRTAWFWARSV